MNHPQIKITVRNYGTMVAELYPEMAPKTVENFLSLVEKNFYENVIFHRVIKGFMIQGGGYCEDFSEKEAASIKGEFAANGYYQNTLKHEKGVLSMARTMDPDSASSQFFIMHAPAPHLDHQYAGFGKVIEGLDVIDAIANVKTGRMGWFDDVPKDPVVIEKIELLK